MLVFVFLVSPIFPVNHGFTVHEWCVCLHSGTFHSCSDRTICGDYRIPQSAPLHTVLSGLVLVPTSPPFLQATQCTSDTPGHYIAVLWVLDVAPETVLPGHG